LRQDEIQTNVVHPVISHKSGRRVELDVLVIPYRIAFEYQGTFQCFLNIFILYNRSTTFRLYIYERKAWSFTAKRQRQIEGLRGSIILLLFILNGNIGGEHNISESSILVGSQGIIFCFLIAQYNFTKDESLTATIHRYRCDIVPDSGRFEAIPEKITKAHRTFSL
jgi:hypothetical protein